MDQFGEEETQKFAEDMHQELRALKDHLWLLQQIDTPLGDFVCAVLKTIEDWLYEA